VASELTGDEAGAAPEQAVEAAEPQPSAGEAPAPRGPVPTRPAKLYEGRFKALYALLALALAAGAAGVVLAATGTSLGNSAPSWSSWRPHGGGLGAASEIAAHVSKAYRLPDGEQLVDVIAKAPSVTPGTQQIPIHYVAVRGKKGAQDQIIQVSSSDSVMFSMCGLGSSCSISSGKPSVERGTLVRREILELALYTFKYVGGMKNVIAFMPPVPGAQPQYVVYLQRDELKEQLGQPLKMTLGPKVPLAAQIPAREVHTIDATTESRVYRYTLSQAQQGDAILVLNPLPA
jgi:hypothetical protein